MNKFNHDSRFTLDHTHASEPEGSDDLDTFVLKHDGQALFEISILRDSDDEDERTLTVKRLIKSLSAFDLPGIHSSMHLGCVVYSFLVESLHAADCEFYAEVFYDDATDEYVERPINLMNAATIPA